MNVIDLPTQVPRTPSGEINVDQLEREFGWNPYIKLNLDEIPAHGGNKFTQDVSFEEFLVAVLRREVTRLGALAEATVIVIEEMRK